MAGWPRPPAPSEAKQQQWAEAEQLRQARAARKQQGAAAVDGKRRGRGQKARQSQTNNGGAAGSEPTA